MDQYIAGAGAGRTLKGLLVFAAAAPAAVLPDIGPADDGFSLLVLVLLLPRRRLAGGAHSAVDDSGGGTRVKDEIVLLPALPG